MTTRMFRHLWILDSRTWSFPLPQVRSSPAEPPLDFLQCSVWDLGRGRLRREGAMSHIMCVEYATMDTKHGSFSSQEPPFQRFQRVRRASGSSQSQTMGFASHDREVKPVGW